MSNSPKITVYTADTIELEQKRVVNHGLGLISDYIGGLANPQFKRVGFKSLAVDITKVRMGSFDINTDLHLLMHDFCIPYNSVPNYAMSQGANIPGASLIGTGTAWVKPDWTHPLTPATIAHELAHSIGYVLPDSPQSIKAVGAHCSSEGCIMGAVANKLVDSFCRDCRADMLDTNEDMFDRIKMVRYLTGTVLE